MFGTFRQITDTGIDKSIAAKRRAALTVPGALRTAGLALAMTNAYFDSLGIP
jgi:hypothetical protein